MRRRSAERARSSRRQPSRASRSVDELGSSVEIARQHWLELVGEDAGTTDVKARPRALLAAIGVQASRLPDRQGKHRAVSVGEHLGELFSVRVEIADEDLVGRLGWSGEDADVVGAELGGERGEAGLQILERVRADEAPRQSFEAAVLGFGRVAVRERRAE